MKKKNGKIVIKIVAFSINQECDGDKMCIELCQKSEGCFWKIYSVFGILFTETKHGATPNKENRR